MSFAWSFPGGKFVQTVVSITLANNTTYNEDVTVPAGKRWILLSARMVNMDNVDRVLAVTKWLEAAITNRIAAIESQTVVAGGGMHIPNLVTGSSAVKHAWFPPGEILEAGNTLRFTWTAGGASAGGTDADGLVYEYLEVDV